MKLSKKILSIVLAVMMVVSMLPITVFADDATTATVLSTINSWQAKKGTADAYIIVNGNKVKATDGYSNVLYQSNDNILTSNETDAGVTWKVHAPTNVVLLYDGYTESSLPVMSETIWPGKMAISDQRIYWINSNNDKMGLVQQWNGYQDGNWGKWPKDNIATTAHINLSFVTNDYHGGGNRSTSRFWWNKLAYTGTGDTTNYYEKISNVSYQMYLTWSNWGSKNNTYTLTPTVDYYVINYAPVVAAVNEAKGILAGASVSDFCDKDALNAYCSAVKALMDLDVTVNGTGDVATVASNIKTAVNAYNVKAKPAKHNPVSANNGVVATCTEDGKESDTICSNCTTTLATGAKIDKTGHSTSYNSTEKTPATCMTQGWTTYSCKNAGCNYSFDVQDIAVNPNAHSWGEYVASADATCENDGQETATCQNGCGTTDTRDVTGSQTGHAYPTTWTKEDDTNHIKVCGNDAEHVMREAHTFGEYVYNNDATTEADGTETATCVCGATSQRPSVGTKIPVGPDNTANLTLDSEISFNLSIDTDYYLENEFEAGTTADEVEYVVEYKQQTVEVGQPAEGVAINATVDAIVADGKTLIKVETCPAQLTEEISVVLKAKDDSKSVTVLDGYSMKDYCDAVITRNGASKAVCEELMRYAATAQVNFNYNTENMAVDVNAPFISQLNADYTALGAYNTPAAVSNDINVAITGVSYVALSDATVRFYLDKTMTEFYKANGCTYGECELTMTMDDQTGSKVYTPYFAMAEGSDEVYIAVPGIESANLDNTFHITMTTKSGKTMSIDYAATTFCKSAVANGSENLKNLAKAIVLYNDAANERFA